jgi:hypothetical protein
MAQTVSTSITRRGAVAGLALTAAPMAVLAGVDNAHAQVQQTRLTKVYTSGWAASSRSPRLVGRGPCFRSTAVLTPRRGAGGSSGPPAEFAVRARDADTSATIVSHRLVRMLLANPTQVKWQGLPSINSPLRVLRRREA